MEFKERVLLYYLVGAIILSRILVLILNWFRTLVTILLITFIILILSRYRENSLTSLFESFKYLLELRPHFQGLDYLRSPETQNVCKKRICGANDRIESATAPYCSSAGGVS